MKEVFEEAMANLKKIMPKDNAKEIRGNILILFLFAGQVGLFIFEKAHEYFQLFIWNKLRRYMFR